MSNSDQPPMDKPPGPRQRSGCATALMLVVGIVLLLPGVLCAILLTSMGESGKDPITPIVMLLAMGGVGLIFWALARK
jgi:hypothetical protein